MKEAAANEPSPISKRRPLTAITAVQALCNKTKSKLVRLMSQDPCLGLFSAGTCVCSVTILVSSPESLSTPSSDAPGWSEVTTEITKSAMRSSALCPQAGTTTWFAFRIGPATFGIFDTFANEAGLQAHLNGAIAKALFAKAEELFAKPPQIQQLEILAAKPL